MVDFNMLTWDNRFMRIAKQVAGWSKDPSTQVGAVIVKDRQIKATGYNGFPKPLADDDRLMNREEKYPRIVHAEMNAILQASHECRGATLYVWSEYSFLPCANCAKHLITAGIARVVINGDLEPPERWVADLAHSENMLREANIIIGRLV